jgi:zinc transporter 9
MLVIEQFSSSHAHHHHTHRLGHHAGVASRDSVFDVELAGLESEEEDIPRHRRASTARTNTETDSPPPAYPITIGLIVHGLADGLALGMSVLSNDDSSSSYSLSLVVFLALAVHKGARRCLVDLFFRCSCIYIRAAPTALAYTVSLMSTSLSRVECRKHLLLFSASTPVGAITSYASFVFFGLKKVEGVGTALLISVSPFDCTALSTRDDPVSGWELPLRCNRTAACLSRSFVDGRGEHENASFSPCVGDLYAVYAGHFTRP